MTTALSNSWILTPRFFAFASSLRNVSGLTMSMNSEFVESYASK